MVVVACKVIKVSIFLTVLGLFTCYTALCLAVLPATPLEAEHAPDIIKLLIYFLISIASFCSMCVVALVTWMFTQLLSLRKRMTVVETRMEDMIIRRKEHHGDDES